MAISINSIAIVGVGLIGGSFGLALRKEGFTGRLIGVSSPGALATALKAGAISETASLEAAAAADIIYLAQPVDRILQTIEALAPIFRPGSLVTDAGSTKAAIVAKASACLPPGSFIGGHPLAGKESRGVESADASLFRGRAYVLTPAVLAPDVAEHPLCSQLRGWIERMGARVIDMSASHHDATVALTSHLPQLISTALAKTLAAQPNEYVRQIFGAGLLDMTRLALSSPDLWRSILSTNKSEVTCALDVYIASLNELRESLLLNNLDSLFYSAATFATEIRK